MQGVKGREGAAGPVTIHTPRTRLTVTNKTTQKDWHTMTKISRQLVLVVRQYRTHTYTPLMLRRNTLSLLSSSHHNAQQISSCDHTHTPTPTVCETWHFSHSYISAILVTKGLSAILQNEQTPTWSCNMKHSPGTISWLLWNVPHGCKMRPSQYAFLFRIAF